MPAWKGWLEGPALRIVCRVSRLFRAAGAISGLTLGSRVLGLWRDSLMAAVLGASRVSDTFLLAWALPNMLRRLLGEGALSASFIPAYARTRKNDGEPAARLLLAQVLGTLLTILLPLVAMVVLGCTLFSATDSGSGDVRTLLLPLSAILFPYTIPICLAAMLAGALNTRGSFALPAALPIALNLIWIAALYAAPWSGCTTAEEIAFLLAVTRCLGGFAQLLRGVAGLWRARALARPQLGWPRRGTPSRMVFTTMAPTVIGMSLGQISSLLDQGMAYGLLVDGANTHLYLANRLLLFPHALTALAVVVAVFPRLASEAAEADRRRMRATLDRAMAAALFVTLPAAVGLIVIAEDVTAVLFQHENFQADDARRTASTTQFLVAGLPFLGLTQLYARAFYAVGDNRTPAVIAGVLVGFNAALNLTLILLFDLGTVGLAAGTSVSAALSAMFLLRRLRRHTPPGAAMISTWLRSLLATGAMATAVAICRPQVDAGDLTGQLLWRIALPITVGIVVYIAVQWTLRSPELQALRDRRRN